MSDMVTSPDAEPLRKATMCTIGAVILPPIYQVHGVYMFFPAISDVMIAIILTIVVVTILHIFGFGFKPWQNIVLGIGIWFIVKMAALALVLMSGDECTSFVFGMGGEFMNPLAAMGKKRHNYPMPPSQT